MNITKYTFTALMAFSLVFVGYAEAKHGSEQARSRVLKEMSKKEIAYKNQNKPAKKGK
jgi:hypothetical protein